MNLCGLLLIDWTSLLVRSRDAWKKQMKGLLKAKGPIQDCPRGHLPDEELLYHNSQFIPAVQHIIKVAMCSCCFFGGQGYQSWGNCNKIEIALVCEVWKFHCCCGSPWNQGIVCHYFNSKVEFWTRREPLPFTHCKILQSLQ